MVDVCKQMGIQRLSPINVPTEQTIHTTEGGRGRERERERETDRERERENTGNFRMAKRLSRCECCA